ncbi:MAG: aminopeptidase P N-terminal domain-containing protein [Filimonas sp.]|nr:aminopeptidase P N-terminal domain-containing protein [Filimonas sp.]
MFSKDTYTSRRERLKKEVGAGLILLPGNEEVGMNYKDNLYHFRQDSTFLYFTGIDRADLVFIFDIDNNKEYLLGDDLTIEQLVWTGPVEPLSSFAAKSGIENVLSYNEAAAMLKKAATAKKQIHYIMPYRGDIAIRISEWLGIPYSSLKQQSSLTLIRAVINQRAYKSAEEIIQIEESINITAQMQLKAIELGKAGLTEYEIAGHVHGTAISGGGNLSFPIILTTNGQFLHNHVGKSKLESGKLLLCDCGAENSMHYAGDLTRTSPVDKKFTPRQKEVYEIVLHAQLEAIKALAPGKLFRDVHFLAAEKLTEGLKSLGIIKGDVKEAVAHGAHTLFFQCGLGHMMGLDVHDMENLGEEYVGYTETLKKSTEFGTRSLRLGRALEPGFVVTVEPGLYFVPDLIDSWRAANKLTQFIDYDKADTFKDFGGIRIEDDYLITDTGGQLLGKPLAKTIAEIEDLKA